MKLQLRIIHSKNSISYPKKAHCVYLRQRLKMILIGCEINFDSNFSSRKSDFGVDQKIC